MFVINLAKVIKLSEIVLFCFFKYILLELSENIPDNKVIFDGMYSIFEEYAIVRI